METAQALCARLREKGYAITPQRQAIFEVLEGARNHPSAEELHEAVRLRLPDVSLATVYKTLKELASMGEIVESNFHEDRVRFDPKVSEHNHIKCSHCGRLEDVDLVFDVDLPPSSQSGFRIERHEVVFYGVCPDCQIQPSSTHA